MEMKMQTMEMAIFGLMFHELIAAQHAMVRAMEQGQEIARHLQHLGSHLAVLGTLHCSHHSGVKNTKKAKVKMEMKMQTMEMAIFSWMIRVLIAAHHAMVRAMEQGQENARHLHHLGSHLAVVGTLHCSVAVCGIANPPQGILAYVQRYKQVILSVLVVFMFKSGFIEIMAGMLVVVNPRPNRRLANIMLWVSHITTVFTVAFLLVRTARASLAL